MVNLIDVVIRRVMGKTGGTWLLPGLRPEAAVTASSWLPGERLALLWVLQVLVPRLGVRSMKLSRPLTSLDSWGLRDQLPFADELTKDKQFSRPL